MVTLVFSPSLWYMRANILGACTTFIWIALDIIFYKMNPNPEGSWGTSFKNPIHTRTSVKLRNNFQGKYFAFLFHRPWARCCVSWEGAHCGGLPDSTGQHSTVAAYGGQLRICFLKDGCSLLDSVLANYPSLFLTSLPPKWLFNST